MKFLRDRPYPLSRIAAVLVATTGGLLALLSVVTYVLGAFFAGPIYGAMYQSGTSHFIIGFCLGLFLLLFGLVARAVFHMAAEARERHTTS